MWTVEWEGCGWEENCDGEVLKPEEFLVEKGQELVGRGIEVKWGTGHGYERGVVERWDPQQGESGKHHIWFDDDTEQWFDLLRPASGKPWRMLPSDA